MAVYTELTHDEIAAHLAAYGLALARAEGIKAGVENTNYLLTLADGKKLILTLFEKRVKSADLPFFAGLMECLAQAGIPSPRPIHTQTDEIIIPCKGKPAILVTFLNGKSANAVNNAQLSELGRHMAQMHVAGQGYSAARANRAVAFRLEDALLTHRRACR